jgi:hypothetical protein
LRFVYLHVAGGHNQQRPSVKIEAYGLGYPARLAAQRRRGKLHRGAGGVEFDYAARVDSAGGKIVFYFVMGISDSKKNRPRSGRPQFKPKG